MIDYLLILCGFVLLIKGADYLVDGASGIAKILRVSDLIIGLTLVAFGTSAPELFVNLFASLKGNASIAVGNIIGSNLFNTLLVLGAASVVYPLVVTKGTVWREIPFSFFAVIILAALSNSTVDSNKKGLLLDRADGVILLICFCMFLYYVFSIAKKTDVLEITETQSRILKLIGMSIAGIAGLALGGKLVVDSAVNVAQQWQVSQSFIGLTIVALGTSLPELVTSGVAAQKKNADIAVGNVVGSNIANIFLVLGVSAVVSPLAMPVSIGADIAVLLVASALLFVFMFTGGKHKLDRWEGIVFICSYTVYMAYLVYRG